MRKKRAKEIWTNNLCSLCHHFLKALRGQKSGTRALNHTQTQNLEEKFALQNYYHVSSIKKWSQKIKAQMPEFQPCAYSHLAFTGASQSQKFWDSCQSPSITKAKGFKVFHSHLSISFIQLTSRHLPSSPTCTHQEYSTTLLAGDTKDSSCVKGITLPSNSTESTSWITRLQSFLPRKQHTTLCLVLPDVITLSELEFFYFFEEQWRERVN